MQFAKHLGFTVFGTCSSQKKGSWTAVYVEQQSLNAFVLSVDLLKELGVDHPINYVAVSGDDFVVCSLLLWIIGGISSNAIDQNDYAQEVKKICPQGVDIVLNSLGGSTVKKVQSANWLPIFLISFNGCLSFAPVLLQRMYLCCVLEGVWSASVRPLFRPMGSYRSYPLFLVYVVMHIQHAILKYRLISSSCV